MNAIVSRTSRIDGRGGNTNSFCAWYSFKMSFCSVPPSRAAVDPGLLGLGDVHREDHRRRRVDRHRRRDRAEIDARVEVLHVGQRVDRHAAAADLAERHRVVGVDAQQRRHVERRRQPVAAGPDDLLEPPVGVVRGAETFDWIDRTAGSGRTVTMIPYPFLYGTYWENVAYWWNVEFWNSSIRRAVVYDGAFTGTPETFPTTPLTFDRTTGRANVSPSRYVAQAVAETRFRLAGTVLGEDRGVDLIRAERPWRAQWLAYDLYRDGWTIPRVDGTIRVFATPTQTTPERRYLTVSVRAPNDVGRRAVRLRTNASSWSARVGEQPVDTQLALCVPANGYADVRVTAPRYSPIYGDPRSEASFVSYARSGGVLVTGIALADETTPC